MFQYTVDNINTYIRKYVLCKLYWVILFIKADRKGTMFHYLHYKAT